jgi:hypothetical protein
VLAAQGDRETETFVVADGAVEVADEYHQVIQAGQHVTPTEDPEVRRLKEAER